jgi:hypothetical protein
MLERRFAEFSCAVAECEKAAKKNRAAMPALLPEFIAE